MSELSKLFSSVLLLAAGFFGASLFGPPELAQRLVRHWSTPRVDPAQGLQPLDPGELIAVRTLPPATEPTLPTTAEPAPFLPPRDIRRTVAKQVTADAWSAPQAVRTSWTTPDFSDPSTPAATPAPAAAAPQQGPSADFNAWLGTAGDWLQRETSADPRREASPAAIEWLPPRESTAAPAAAGEPGPALFPSQSSPAPVAGPVSRELREPVADAWGLPPADSLGPPPAVDWPSRADEAARRLPVAREATPTTYGTHVVADGDTLPRLAERYLGDATRGRELYELNRGLLESPDLLPIGVILSIPNEPRRAPAAPAGSRSTAAFSTPFSTVSAPAPGLSVRSAAEEPRLVPIDRTYEAPPREPDARYFGERSW